MVDCRSGDTTRHRGFSIGDPEMEGVIVTSPYLCVALGMRRVTLTVTDRDTKLGQTNMDSKDGPES